MVSDWQTAAGELAALGPALGYVGFSMGSIFGLPTVASMPSIRAAVFVVGGLPSGPWVNDPVLSRTLLKAASSLTDQEVLMVNMTRDELFTAEGAHELFNALGGDTKRLQFWPGNHDDWPDEAIEETVMFLRQHTSR